MFCYIFFCSFNNARKKVSFGKQLKAFISLWNNVEVFNYIQRKFMRIVVYRNCKAPDRLLSTRKRTMARL